MRTNIEAANLADLPSVLDMKQAEQVLRMGANSIRAEVKAGRLNRLAYTQSRYLFWSGEIERFLSEQSGGVS